ncbi:MAG: ABC transporter ATP-binding protein [Bacillus sp. (in: firmicutes)]
MNIEAKHISKSFDGRKVVNDVSFTVEQGRCVALIGPNGAGKTTLLHMLVGLIESDSGTISYHQDANWRNEIGFMPQIPSFYGWMTPNEFLRFTGKLAHLDKTKLKERIAFVLQLTGISEAANRKIQGFSGGMKQRLGLAQALLHQPSLLILDEPVSALDPVGRRDVMNILNELKKTTTIIYSTHILHDAEEISDDILLIRDGAIVAHGTLEELLSRATQNYSLRASNPLPHELSQCEFIKEIYMVGEYSADIILRPDGTKEQLLRWCLDHHVDLVHFHQGKQTLESVFMEVVKS